MVTGRHRRDRIAGRFGDGRRDLNAWFVSDDPFNLNERRREIAILCLLGARSRTIDGLLVGEATLLTVAGSAIGTAALYAVLMVARPLIDRQFGIDIVIQLPSMTDALLLLVILIGGIAAGFLPAYRAYRMSLADGLMVRT